MTQRWLVAASALGAALVVAAVLASDAQAALRRGPSVTVAVSLSRHDVRAGSPIKGTVAFTNTSAHPITVNFCAANGWLAVGLKNGRYSPSFVHSAVQCPPTIHLRPGTNRFPVTVSTTYSGCLEPGGQSTVSIPACLPGNRLPPLPAGRYVTTVSISGLDNLTSVPKTVRVTLLEPNRSAEPLGG